MPFNILDDIDVTVSSSEFRHEAFYLISEGRIEELQTKSLSWWDEAFNEGCLLTHAVEEGEFEAVRYILEEIDCFVFEPEVIEMLLEKLQYASFGEFLDYVYIPSPSTSNTLIEQYLSSYLKYQKLSHLLGRSFIWLTENKKTLPDDFIPFCKTNQLLADAALDDPEQLFKSAAFSRDLLVLFQDYLQNNLKKRKLQAALKGLINLLIQTDFNQRNKLVVSYLIRHSDLLDFLHECFVKPRPKEGSLSCEDLIILSKQLDMYLHHRAEIIESQEPGVYICDSEEAFIALRNYFYLTDGKEIFFSTKYGALLLYVKPSDSNDAFLSIGCINLVEEAVSLNGNKYKSQVEANMHNLLEHYSSIKKILLPAQRAELTPDTFKALLDRSVGSYDEFIALLPKPQRFAFLFKSDDTLSITSTEGSREALCKDSPVSEV